jgi:hypothetical protein
MGWDRGLRSLIQWIRSKVVSGLVYVVYGSYPRQPRREAPIENVSAMDANPDVRGVLHDRDKSAIATAARAVSPASVPIRII